MLHPSPPTADDFGSMGDEWYARDHFLGKSLHEARAMFRTNPLRYFEDLHYMSVRAFRHYVPAAIDYVLSPEANGDGISVKSLIQVIASWHQQEPEAIAGVAPAYLVALHTIRDDLERFFEPQVYAEWRSDKYYGTIPADLDHLIAALSQKPPRPTKAERRRRSSGPRAS